MESKQNIQVYIRVRPRNEKEEGSNVCLIVPEKDGREVIVNKKPLASFCYDGVADEDASQESVFVKIAASIIEKCVEGYNGTIFAYGQTGSGKTYTMQGPDVFSKSKTLRGLIPRALEYLFLLIKREEEKTTGNTTFLCKCSYLEIYNESIYDLLNPSSQNLHIRQSECGMFVENLFQEDVTNANRALELLQIGSKNRTTGPTAMNIESSRSHSVFTLSIECQERTSTGMKRKYSRLNLIDLAGSESQKRTEAAGVRLSEACSINKSLSALGNVIRALSDNYSHVPYRDAKLTLLLKDSLGGNSNTAIIATVSPSDSCLHETLSTLKFAQRAKKVKNSAIVNFDMSGSVGQLQAEIQRLQLQLQKIQSGGSMIGTFDVETISKCLMHFTEKENTLDHVRHQYIDHKMNYRWRIKRLIQERQTPAVVKEILQHELDIEARIEKHPRIVELLVENQTLKEELSFFEEHEDLQELRQICQSLLLELKKQLQNSEATLGEEFETYKKEADFERQTLNTRIIELEKQVEEQYSNFQKLKEGHLQEILKLKEQMDANWDNNQEKDKQILELLEEKNRLETLLEEKSQHIHNMRASLMKTDLEKSRMSMKQEQLQTRLSTASALLHKAEEENSSLSSQMREAREAARRDLEEKNFQLETALNDKEEQIQQLKQQIEDMEISLETSQYEHQQLQQQFQQSEASHRTLQQTLEELQNNSSKKVETITQESACQTEEFVDEAAKEYEREISSMRSLVDEKETAIQSLQLQSKEAMETFTKQVNELQEQLQSAKERIQFLEDQAMLKETNLKEIEAIHSKTKKELEELNKNVEHWKKELDNKNIEVEELETMLEKNQTRLFETQELLDKVEQEKSHLTRENAKLNKTNNELIGSKNQNQKINHVLELKQENNRLKKELAQIKSLWCKQNMAVKENIHPKVTTPSSSRFGQHINLT